MRGVRPGFCTCLWAASGRGYAIFGLLWDWLWGPKPAQNLRNHVPKAAQRLVQKPGRAPRANQLQANGISALYKAQMNPPRPALIMDRFSKASLARRGVLHFFCYFLCRFGLASQTRPCVITLCCHLLPIVQVWPRRKGLISRWFWADLEAPGWPQQARRSPKAGPKQHLSCRNWQP